MVNREFLGVWDAGDERRRYPRRASGPAIPGLRTGQFTGGCGGAGFRASEAPARRVGRPGVGASREAGLHAGVGVGVAGGELRAQGVDGGSQLAVVGMWSGVLPTACTLLWQDSQLPCASA